MTNYQIIIPARRVGKGNKPNPAPVTTYNTAVTEAKKQSPAEEALNRESLKTIDWASKGDFTNPAEGGIFVNYADPAFRRRHRELSMNAGDQGIFALGPADPNALAAMKENSDAASAENDAAQYQDDIRTGVGQARAQAGDMSQMDLNRRLGILNETGATYRADLTKPQQPKWWERLLGGAMNAGAAFAGSSAGSAAIAGI